VGVSEALESAAAAGHTAMLGELVVYLRRAGFPTQAPTEVPEPWAAGLAGRWREAAAGWEALGDRYERAVELGLADEPAARDQGVHLLTELGAGAAVSRLTVGTSATFWETSPQPQRRSGKCDTRCWNRRIGIRWAVEPRRQHLHEFQDDHATEPPRPASAALTLSGSNDAGSKSEPTHSCSSSSSGPGGPASTSSRLA
jgi:hypothetical protein